MIWVAVERALGQLEAHPSAQVDHVRADAAGRGLGVGLALEGGLPLAVDSDVDVGAVLGGDEVGVARAGGGHAGRVEQHLVGQLSAQVVPAASAAATPPMVMAKLE